MINLLKPAREIVADLNRFEPKWKSILIHGIGRIQNVTYCEERGQYYYWTFKIKINDGIIVDCFTTKYRDKMDSDYFWLEEGDWIEFFGAIKTYDTKMFCRYNVANIAVRDLKLAEEKRAFSEVLMWDIKIHKGYPSGNKAVTLDDKFGMVESQIACRGEDELLDRLEKNWSYGQLVRKGKDVILQLIKVIK